MYIDWKNTQRYNWHDKELISSIDWKNVEWNASGRVCTYCKTNEWYKHIDWDDKELVISIVEWDWEDIQYCSTRLRDDFDVVMAAVRDYGLALHLASDRLKNNEEIVKRAITTYSYSYRYASKELKENPEIVEFAMNNSPYVYPDIPNNFQTNFDYAMAAVKKDWINYKKVVKNIKGLNKNVELLIYALIQSKDVLDFVSNKFHGRIKKYILENPENEDVKKLQITGHYNDYL